MPNNQRVISCAVEVIIADDEQCIANWQMNRVITATNEKQRLDGIFQIKLDENNKLTYFRQWRWVEVEK